MEEKSFVLELSDGTEVKFVEVWVIDDLTNDSYPLVEIYDCETNHRLASYRGILPDTEDEDFDCEELATMVEDIIYCRY